jgi:hypothetical protein|tara:strand:+ start:2392 stop:2925 length:534 start_codon:yes stop_codon:yes gene_type:complete
MKIQYELFPLPKQKILEHDRFDIHNIGYDKHYKTDYSVVPKHTFFIYKTGGMNRYLKKMGPVFPYIKNEVTGNLISVSSTSTDHYVKTNISLRNGTQQTKVIRIHRVAAFAFIHNPDPDNFAVVHHKNGNVLDYRLENLEWTSQSSNMKDVDKSADKYKNRHALLEEKGHSFDFKLE